MHGRHACLGNTTALSTDSKDGSPSKHHPDLALLHAHGEDGLAQADTPAQAKQNSLRAKTVNHEPKEKREDSIWQRVDTVQGGQQVLVLVIGQPQILLQLCVECCRIVVRYTWSFK